jgi:AmiR/NasT family two-component response regulator
MQDAPQSSLERLEKTFEANALAAVREPLQKKHLYQNVRISTGEVIRQAQEGVRQPLDAAAIDEFRRPVAESWQVEDA